jgi:hypothetical protein
LDGRGRGETVQLSPEGAQRGALNGKMSTMAMIAFVSVDEGFGGDQKVPVRCSKLTSKLPLPSTLPLKKILLKTCHEDKLEGCIPMRDAARLASCK